MENNMADDKHKRAYDMLNQISRSTIAIIDTVTQRGGFRGEELSTIGNLRDQCTNGVQVVESYKQDQEA
jgi:Mg2+ and Co2+ transporter CorA